jgi:hypothetical protein
MKFILTTFALLFVYAGLLFAQPPPSLPSAPSQAPIDGGLSVVALAGSVYAWKKLRASKK